MEAWVPEDPTNINTIITKLGLSVNGKFINEITESGIIKKSAEATINSLSLIFTQMSGSDRILTEFDINASYNEIVDKERSASIDVKPIKIKLKLTQLKVFQKFIDKITDEMKLIDLPSERMEDYEAIKEIVPENQPEKLPIKLNVSAKIELLKFELEDDFAKYKYPFVRMWIAKFAANILLDPTDGKDISGQIFEVSIDLGDMFDKDTENAKLYIDYLNTLSWSNLDQDITNLHHVVA